MAEVHPTPEDALENPDVHYERRDVGVVWMLIGASSIFILAIIGLFVSLWFYNVVETRQIELDPTPLPLIELRPTPPGPRLQPNPIDQRTAEEDIAELRAREEELLNNYEWVNRESGIIRIPVEKAIDLLSDDMEIAEPDR
jgi:hypothetical protein